MRMKATITTATPEEIRAAYDVDRARLKDLKCKLCNNSFKQRRLWQEFCSTRCRVNYSRIGRRLSGAESKDL